MVCCIWARQKWLPALPPLWAFWRDFEVRYVTALTAIPEDGELAVAAPDALVLKKPCAWMRHR